MSLIRQLFRIALTLSLLTSSYSYALEGLKYKVVERDEVGTILNQLGICPLWGPRAKVSETIKLNPHINPQRLSKNTWMLLPVTDLPPAPHYEVYENIIRITQPGAELCILKNKNIEKIFISEINLPQARPYKAGEALVFSLRFTEPVFLNFGQPRLQVRVGQKDRQANYIGGSGTRELRFAYTVTERDPLNGGDEIKALNILEEGSHIEGKNRKFVEISFNEVGKFVPAPEKSITKPLSVELVGGPTFKSGDDLRFKMIFDKNVFVSGDPQLVLVKNNDSLKTRFIAEYEDGDETNELLFKMSVPEGHTIRGLILENKIALQKGAIKDELDQDIDPSLESKEFDVLVDTTTPELKKVMLPKTGIYSEGQTLDFILRFSKPVTIDEDAYFSLALNEEEIRDVVYVEARNSMEHLFRFSVPEGELETKGMILLEKLKGSVRDESNKKVSVKLPLETIEASIDTKPPMVEDVIIEGKKHFSQKDSVGFKVKFSEPVVILGEPKYVFKIGEDSFGAGYKELLNPTEALFTFKIRKEMSSFGKKVVATSQILTDSKSSIKDFANHSIAENGAVLKDLDIRIDGSVPMVKDFFLIGEKIYKAGDSLIFKLLYTENVTGQGKPKLDIKLAGEPQKAVYSKSSENVAFFEYPLPAGLNEKEILLLSPVDTSEGNLVNKNETPADGSFKEEYLFRRRVIDTAPPRVEKITWSDKKKFKYGDVISLAITFNEKVSAPNELRLKTSLGESHDFILQTKKEKTLGFEIKVKKGLRVRPGELKVSGIEEVFSKIMDHVGNTVAELPVIESDFEIDSEMPVVQQINLADSKYYKRGDKLLFTIAFSKPVSVEGFPEVKLSLDSGTVTAKYASGGGTNALQFAYIVGPTDESKTGASIRPEMRLVNARVFDEFGNAFDGDLPPNHKIAGLISGIAPKVEKLTYPQDQQYKIGDTLRFIIHSTDTLSASGSIKLRIKLDSSEKLLLGQLSEDKKTIHFDYQVMDGDRTSGLKILSPLIVEGSLANFVGTEFEKDFTQRNRPEIFIDGDKPHLAEIEGPAKGLYKLGDKLIYTLNFTETIIWPKGLNLKLNIPDATLTHENGQKSKKVTFSYVVKSQDLLLDDSLRIIFTPELETVIADAAGNHAIIKEDVFKRDGVSVDGVAPFLSDMTSDGKGVYMAGETLRLKLDFSEIVTVGDSSQLTLKLATGNTLAKYIEGSGTSSLIYEYTIARTDHDKDGLQSKQDLDLSLAQIKDVAGNKVVTSISVDKYIDLLVVGNESTIASIDPSRRGIFRKGDNLDIDVKFNRDVKFESKSAHLNLEVGDKKVQAKFLMKLRPDTFRFRYKVEDKVDSWDGIVVNSPLVSDSDFVDEMGLRAAKSFSPFLMKDIIVDTGTPHILSLEAPPAGEYSSGDELTFKVTFSEPVILQQVPSLVLDLKSGKVSGKYLAGSGTRELFFKYTVQDGDFEKQNFLVESPIRAPRNSIMDAAGNSANLKFKETVRSDIKVVGSIPYVTKVKAPEDRAYGKDDILNFEFNFSGKVFVSGHPYLVLDVGGQEKKAKYKTGNGTDRLIFEYKIQANDSDLDGVKMVSPLEAQGGSISSIHGVSAKINFEQPDTRRITINTHFPKVLEIRTLVANHLKASDKFAFSLVFNEPVKVSGSPRVKIRLAHGEAFADYRSGSGTNTLYFEYVVSRGDNSVGGIEILSPVLVDSGSLIDNEGNSADTMFTAFQARDVVIDSIQPEIVTVKVAEDKTYEDGEDIIVKVKFSEPVTVTGQPHIPLTMKTGATYASYLYGSGSDELVFNYRVQLGDQELEGINFELPLNTMDGEVYDLARNKLGVNLSKFHFANVKVDASATNPYSRALASSRPTTIGGGNQFNLAGSSPFSNYEVFSNVTSVTLDATDNQDGKKARLTSGSNIGVGARWFKKWSTDWESYVGFGLKKITFEEASNRKVENTSNYYSKLSLGINHLYKDNLKFMGEFSWDKRPYIYSKDTKTLLIDPVAVYKISSGATYAFRRFGPYQMGVQVLGEVLLPKKSDNFSLQMGYGATSTGFIRQDMKKGFIKAEVFYDYTKQNSDISAQIYTEFGFSFSLNYPLGGTF